MYSTMNKYTSLNSLMEENTFGYAFFQNTQESQENKSQMTEFWKTQLTSTPKVRNLIWATIAIVYWQARGWPWVSKPWIIGITSI